MKNKILFGLVFLCMVGSVLAVDGFVSLQAYVKGGQLNVNAVPTENGVRVYNVSVYAECIDSNGVVNFIGSTDVKYLYTGFINNSLTSCKKGDLATVCADNFCKDVNITQKRIHIGHKVKVKPVIVSEVKVVNPFDVLNDEFKSCKLNASIWLNDSLKDCLGLYGKKLYDCNMFNFLVYQQFNFKLLDCKLDYDKGLCKLNNGTWLYHKCVVRE